MRRHDPRTWGESALGPDAERELEALDRALAGEPVGDAELADIALLVDAVRTDAPRMTPQFAARMDEDLAAGFPRPPRRGAISAALQRVSHPGRPRLPRMPRPGVLAPAIGVMAAVLIGLMVVLGAGSGDTDDEGVARSSPAVRDGIGPTAAGGAAERAPSGGAAESAPSGAAEPLSSASKRMDLPEDDLTRRAAPGIAPVPPPSADLLAPDQEDRKVQRSAFLALEAPDGELQSVADDVVRTTDRLGGIVASSSIDDGEQGGEAAFDLRIPTAQLDEALAAYSRLGSVAQRRQDLTDITGAFASSAERLTDARAERRGLQRALGRATTEREISSLRSRLRTVRGTIARLNGERDALRRRADLATISLTVRSDGPGAGEQDGGGAWTPGDAARDAGRVLEVAAGVALIALAVAVPLALLGAPALIGARIARRRRREAALDGT